MPGLVEGERGHGRLVAIEGDLGVAGLGVEEADGAVVVPDRQGSAAHLDLGHFRPLHCVCLVNLAKKLGPHEHNYTLSLGILVLSYPSGLSDLG